MRVDFWMKIGARKSRYGGRWEFDGTPKTFRNKPDVGANEIPIKVNLEVPDSYFADPAFSLSLAIPERPGGLDVSIHPKLQQDIENLIAEDLGVKVHISVSEDETE